MVVWIVLNDMFNISQMSKSRLIILPTLLHTSNHLEKRGLHRYKVYILVGEKIRTIGTLDVKISGFVSRTYPVSRTCKRLYIDKYTIFYAFPWHIEQYRSVFTTESHVQRLDNPSVTQMFIHCIPSPPAHSCPTSPSLTPPSLSKTAKECGIKGK